MLVLAAPAGAVDGGAAAAPQRAAGASLCAVPEAFDGVRLLQAAGDRRRDAVKNLYRLVEPSDAEPDPARAALSGPATVEVWFHVIRSAASGNTANGDIPESWLDNQVAALNTAYSGGTGGVDTGFRFHKAGSDRTTNASWFADVDMGTAEETAMKTALRKGSYRTLNVYTVDLTNTGGLLGWATFPEKKPDDATRLDDGVVVEFQSLPGGNAGDSDFDYHEGDSLTHEAGHWLGLYHTFEGSCSGGGDLVSDTPAEAFPNFDCDPLADSCSAKGLDPVHNFMDYTDDVCMTEFTAGQTKRMNSLWKLRELKAAPTGFAPTEGGEGTPVTITGSNLSDVTAVNFGKVPAVFAVVSDTQVTTTVPAGAKSTKIELVNPAGKAKTKGKFRVTPS